MKTLIALFLLSSSNAFAAKCILEKVNADGKFGDKLIQVLNMNPVTDINKPVAYTEPSGVYKMIIAKLTQQSFGVNIYQNDKLILQTYTIATNTNYQWVRSSVLTNADGSGVSFWCSESTNQ